MRKLKKHNFVVICLFVILYSIGLFNLSYITGDWDENTEQNILLSNFKSYANRLKIYELNSFIEDEGYLPININEDRDHGIAVFYPLILVVLLRYVLPGITSIIWHLYIYSFFFIGVIYFYKLMNLMYNNKKISIIATMLYYFSPRILIASFHNNKDIIFMTLLLILIYYLGIIIKKGNNKDMIKFAIVGAFLCNVKVLGIFFTGIIGLTYIIYLIINQKMNKERVIDIVFTLMFMFLIYYLITPAIWEQYGINLIGFIKYCLKRDSKFNWAGKLIFEGKSYHITIDELPIHYLPKYILLTLPPIVPIIFVLAILMFFKHKIVDAEKISIKDYITITSIIIFVITFSIYFILKPNLYNGWRHFYFLYTPIMIIVSYGLYSVYNSKKEAIKIIGIIIISLSILSSSYSIIKNGIKNVGYFNIYAGKGDLSKKYDIDPYGITTKDAIKKFQINQRIKDSDRIQIYKVDYSVSPTLIRNLKRYNYIENNKIEIVTNSEVDKYLKKGKKIYMFVSSSYDDVDLTRCKKVYSYKYNEITIVDFYEYTKECYGA